MYHTWSAFGVGLLYISRLYTNFNDVHIKKAYARDRLI